MQFDDYREAGREDTTSEIVIEQHFVRYFSPGTLVAEVSNFKVDSWCISAAKAKARTIVERHGAKPYCFQFYTCGRGADDLNSRVIRRSPRYFFNGTVRTAAEVRADGLDDERILRANISDKDDATRIFTTTKGWRWTQILREDDELITLDEDSEGGVEGDEEDEEGEVEGDEE